MQYGSLTIGKPEWLKQVKEQRKAISLGGITYRETDVGIRNCLMVRDYANLISNACDFSELICQVAFGDVFVDLGNAPEGHDLIINCEGGKVYVNGHCFRGVTGLVCLGDGSWGIDFQDSQPAIKEKGLVCLVISAYKWFLDEVYEKSSYLGLVEINRHHERSIKHLIFDNLPKGIVISKISA